MPVTNMTFTNEEVMKVTETIAANSGVNVLAGKPAVAIHRDPEITWAAITDPSSLKYNGTSAVAVDKALLKAFGKYPIKLEGERAILMLTAMAAVAGEGSAPYDILAAALERFGAIEINRK